MARIRKLKIDLYSILKLFKYLNNFDECPEESELPKTCSLVDAYIDGQTATMTMVIGDASFDDIGNVKDTPEMELMCHEDKEHILKEVLMDCEGAYAKLQKNRYREGLGE